MALAEVAVAAIDRPASPALGALGILLAASAGLSLSTTPVHAGQIEEAQLGVNYFSYQEKDGRMKVSAPLGWVQAPLARDVDLEARITLDGVSGASPQYVSNQSGKPVHALSSASIRENRKEGMIKATRWLGDDSLSLGATVSSEHDYLSQSVSADGKFEFLNKNVTLAVGASLSRDSISATGKTDVGGNRITRSLFTGLSQVLTPDDIIQSNLAFSDGNGYFDDPYKFTQAFLGRRPIVHIDQRPDNRRSLAWLTRWRHYLPYRRAALGVDYRYTSDSWGIRSHMLETSWHQNLNEMWALKPSLRYYNQSAADFYATSFSSAQGIGSADTRLGAFGALTLAINAVAKLGERDTLELSLGRYAQRAGWRPGGGSADLPAFDASYTMASWTRAF